MPVFDFAQEDNEKKESVKTYTTFKSDEPEATKEKPILVLEDGQSILTHHINGCFTNPVTRTSFEAEMSGGDQSFDILKIDIKF